MAKSKKQNKEIHISKSPAAMSMLGLPEVQIPVTPAPVRKKKKRLVQQKKLTFEYLWETMDAECHMMRFLKFIGTCFERIQIVRREANEGKVWSRCKDGFDME